MKKILFMLSLLFFGNLVIGQDVVQKYQSDGAYDGIIPYKFGPSSFIAFGARYEELFFSFLDDQGQEINSLQVSTIPVPPENQIDREPVLGCKYLMVDKYDHNVLWGIMETLDYIYNGQPISTGDDFLFRFNISTNEVFFSQLNFTGQELSNTLHQTGVNEVMLVSAA